MKKPSRVELKRRRRRRNLRVFLFISIFIGLIIFLRKSPLFNISLINVKGNIKTEKKDIIEATGVKLNENIFTIKTRDIKNNIESNPYVKKSSVKRVLPNKLEINIIERIEVVQIKYQNAYLKVDNEGIVMEETDVVVPTIPTIYGLDLPEVELGENIFKVLNKEDVYEEISSVKEKDLFGEIKEVNIEEWSIKISLFSGIDILLEDFTDLEYKSEMLLEVLNYIEENQIVCNLILMNKGDSPIIVRGSNEG